jgi:hypothetical protein
MRLVKTLIYRRQPVGIRFTRRVEFAPHEIRVRDSLVGADGTHVASLRRDPDFTTIHMGSSRYFVNHELSRVPAGEDVDPRAIVDGLTIDRAVTIDT